jgi:hypothetical protein
VPLHHGFAGVAAEVEVAYRRPEAPGNGLEFIGGVEQRGQILGELRPVDARHLPELALATGHDLTTSVAPANLIMLV